MSTDMTFYMQCNHFKEKFKKIKTPKKFNFFSKKQDIHIDFEFVAYIGGNFNWEGKQVENIATSFILAIAGFWFFMGRGFDWKEQN